MIKNFNYLDYIPVHSPKLTWYQNNGRVTLCIYHKGFYMLVAQKLFNKPKLSHISLDKYGSFIWLNIDSKNTIGNIADNLKREFGKDVEPLYNRLVIYMKILKNNKFICYKRCDDNGNIK